MHAAAVTHAVFSPDAKQVLTAAADMTLHLWDVENRQEVFMALQLRGPVAGLAFRADGKRFLTVTDKAPMGATEVELHVREAATGEAVREEALGSEILPRPAVFSPDGQRGIDDLPRSLRPHLGHRHGQTGRLVLLSCGGAGAGVVQCRWRGVLTASVDGTARVWKAPPLSPPRGGEKGGKHRLSRRRRLARCISQSRWQVCGDRG